MEEGEEISERHKTKWGKTHQNKLKVRGRYRVLIFINENQTAGEFYFLTPSMHTHPVYAHNIIDQGFSSKTK